MTPAFLTGLDMLKQMQSLTGCCDTQPPVVVYRDRPGLAQKPLAPAELARVYRGPGVHDADRKSVSLAAFMRIFTLAEQVHNITGEGA